MYTLIVCCIANGLASSSRAIAGNAGKIVSIENGPNIASAASSGASRRRRGVTSMVIRDESGCATGAAARLAHALGFALA